MNKTIPIKAIRPTGAYKCDDCPYCAFHETEPGVCEACEDGDQFEPVDSLELEAA